MTKHAPNGRVATIWIHNLNVVDDNSNDTSVKTTWKTR